MKQKSNLGKKIKRSRERVGLSQKALGKALRLSDKAVSSYEVGRSEPSLQVLQQISKITQTPFQYFMQEQESSELELSMRLKKIENELLAVKKLLEKQKK